MANAGISPEVSKSMKIYLPVVVAGGAGYVAWQKKASWQVLLIVMGAAWLLSWLLAKTTLNLVADTQDKPKQVDIPAGALPASFNGKVWADRLYNDISCFICTRDKDLYRDMVNMTDYELLDIANHWNRHHYTKDKETMALAMRREWYDIFSLGSETWDNATALQKRFENLGI